MEVLEIALVSFLFGVAGWFLGIWFLIACAIGLLVILAFFKPARKQIILFLLIATASASGGFFWSGHFVFSHASHIPESDFNKKETFQAVISDDPDRGIEGTAIVAELKSGDHVRIGLPAGTDALYGDRIEFSGTLKHPESFTTDTGREFDYPTYLLVHGITATTNIKSITIVSHHNKPLFVESLFSIKKYFVDAIKKLFPSPESGLFAGIVIGEKSLLPKYNLQEFQIAGLTHMIVLSGYNITIVALFVMTALAWLGVGYRARRVGAILAIPVFIVMTGMGASSVRAGIMAIIVFALQLDTRPANSLRVILLTLATMVFVNPYALLYDPSLHLSFLAFIGLVYVTPITQHYFEKWNVQEYGGMRDLLIETMSVQFFVLPYIIWMSGRVSVLTLVSNLITVPLTPLVMGTGFAVTIIGMIAGPLGAIFAKPVSWVMTYMLSVAHIVASMHFATFVIPPFGGWVMAGIYLTICIIVYIYSRIPTSHG
ncbi:MAG: internalization-related competence protein ComEC/Rec2, competence protein ComEC protein [Patescibacteria group bacterium]|nr:internalization-related competence protein ComEC/Rec2, competence protein ComEC protein [Patescibacteria group bacterium]